MSLARWRRLQRASWIVLAPCIVVSALAWAAVAAEHRDEVGSAIRLSVPRAEFANGRVSVDLVARNRSSAGRQARVWYTLVDPVDERVAYRSAPADFLLGAEARHRVKFDEAIAVLPGRYEIQGWLHGRARDHFVPMAAGTSTLVRVPAPRQSMFRTMPARSARITDVRVSPSSGANPIGVVSKITAKNLIPSTRDLLVEVALVPEPIGSRTDWTALGARWLPTASMRVDPLGTSTVALAQELAISPGHYALRVRLLAGQRVVDDVLIRPDLLAGSFDQTVERTNLPAGSVMIEAVDAPQAWNADQSVDVGVRLRNLSDVSHAARAFVVVAATSASKPWRSPESRCMPVDVELGPNETKDAVVSCTRARDATGSLQLTAWAHIRGPGGKFVHSDGVVMRNAVTFPSQPDREPAEAAAQ
jgi:hypothetical protein